tara:strand:+ start:127 stop:522 length:396 start_codon:yes stop_codon:yes gene_type:complete
MASFAKIGLNSKVMEVVVVHNNELLDSNGVEQEVNGINFLTNLTGWSIWKQTSFNTHGNVHSGGGTPIRKNYAGVGYIYDETLDAFYLPQPYNSWTLNETTCLWEPPVSYPSDGSFYLWNESNKAWDSDSL